MQSGKLRHLGKIEQPDDTVDAAGQAAPVWSDYKTGVWVSIDPISGTTDEERGRSAAQGRFQMKARYLSAVIPAMRWSGNWNGAAFVLNIESVLPDPTDRRYIIITGTQEING